MHFHTQYWKINSHSHILSRTYTHTHTHPPHCEYFNLFLITILVSYFLLAYDPEQSYNYQFTLYIYREFHII